MTTILEALQNAQFNFNSSRQIPELYKIAKNQLDNAVALLEKGYDKEDEIDPLIEKYGNVNNVPDKE